MRKSFAWSRDGVTKIEKQTLSVPPASQPADPLQRICSTALLAETRRTGKTAVADGSDRIACAWRTIVPILCKKRIAPMSRCEHLSITSLLWSVVAKLQIMGPVSILNGGAPTFASMRNDDGRSSATLAIVR